MAHYPTEISVVVPVYASGTTLPELVARINRAMQNAGLSHELILVNDASPDSTTWPMVQDLCRQYAHLTGITLPRNRGQWYATLVGMEQARGRYIVSIDDDLEYDPDDIPLLYQTAVNGNHPVVFGLAAEKYARQGKNVRMAAWRNRLLNRLWNKGVTDSFRCIRRNRLFAGERFLPRGHVEAFLVARVPRHVWGYVPVRFHQRPVGTSNYTLWKKLPLLLLFSLHYIRRPAWWVAVGSGVGIGAVAASVAGLPGLWLALPGLGVAAVGAAAIGAYYRGRPEGTVMVGERSSEY